MHTVDDYAKFRTAHRDGMTIRQIARSFHVSRRKVRDALASPEPAPYTRTKPPPAPVLGPFTAIIDQVLRDDRGTPPPSSSAGSRMSTDTPAPTPRSVATSPHAARTPAPPSFPWLTRPAGDSKPTSDTSTLTSPTADALSPSLSP